MTPTTLFRRYIWLLGQIYNAGYITKEEIDRRWAHSYFNETGEQRIPERTFYRHKEAISELFGIEIVCDKSANNAYYIRNSANLHNNMLKSWLISSLSVDNIVSESKQLSNRILFENIPSGQQFLTTIIEAMRDELSLAMHYCGFHDNEDYECEVEPYCVKVFRKRWYLLGHRIDHRRSEVRIYPLDRMVSVEVSHHKFSLPADFDADEYFYDFFGTYTDPLDGPEHVVVKVSAWQSNYIRSLPLHHSQREVERVPESHPGAKDGYSVFEFRIVPTFDFLQELMTHGHQLEVLEPAWVRDEMAWEASETVKLYRHRHKPQK